ncbi:MAG: DUF4932 domain-containing protein [Elusimicrobiales bacterium]
MKRVLSPGLAALISAAGIVPAAALPQAEAPRPVVSVTVDPRVELVSIIFRLAGNKEYNRGRVPGYVRDVEEHFGPHKDHPAVKYAAELRQKHSIAYNAPMGLAVYITDTLTFGERAPLSPLPAELDDRWTTQTARQFIAQARKFSEDTGFNAFFEKHRPLYQASERGLQEVLDKHARLEWFDSFFGPRTGAEFKAVLSLLAGGGNYGASLKLPGGGEELYSILGVWRADKEGTPVFPPDMASTLVHELGHSYTNPVVERFESSLREPGQKIYVHVADQMKEQAYGNWITMMFESVLRACELRYALATGGPEAVKKKIAYENSRSFYWVAELGELLARYEEQPRKYKDFAEFFPQVADFFKAYAPKAAEKIAAAREAERAAKEKQRLELAERMKDWREKGPRIVSVVPADGSEVGAGLKAIVVTFDRPMARGWSFIQTGPGIYPGIAGNPAYDAAMKVVTLPIELQPGKAYSFGLNSEQFLNFRSAEGVPLFPVEVHFRTAPAVGTAGGKTGPV